MAKDKIDLSSATPMIKQYLEIKSGHQDCLLLFRLGDFYELFFQDALIAAPILEVVLTRRGKAENAEEIPMCGIPYHAANNYIQKLIKAGYRVAICDQMESPEEAKKRAGYKAVVKREVVRILTAGTLTEEVLLDAKQPNYLCAIAYHQEDFAIAYADISTLEFKTLITNKDGLLNELSRLDPKELIIPDSLITNLLFKELKSEFKERIINFVDSFFQFAKCQKKCLDNFAIKTTEIFGNLTDLQISACGAILEYLSITQKKAQISLNFPQNLAKQKFLSIDAATSRSLEIFNTSGDHKNTVFNIIDSTVTAIGSRLLRTYLAFPLQDVETINSRLDIVEKLLNNSKLRQEIQASLKLFPDLERIMGKVASGRSNPQDFYLIKNSLSQSRKIKELLHNLNEEVNQKYFSSFFNNLKDCDLQDVLEKALINYDQYLNQKDYIKPQYSQELAQCYQLRDHAQNLIDNLRDEYRALTGVLGLKIEFNNVLGYFIEVTKLNAPKLQENSEFIHRQSMVNCARFSSVKLKELEQKILGASSKLAEIELQIFHEINHEIMKFKDHLLKIARSIAFFDVVSSFAQFADENKFCKPIIDDSYDFNIEDGRHVVIDRILKNSKAQNFIANNCNLATEQNLWLITGPNMAGKSTFLRQNAIIALLAHIGSFVPATYCKIGLVDKIFSRVGSSDDLSRGHSTFLVEMIETATILNQATKRSFVIIDEIGRGTSTYDGMAIAWSCLEYLHENINCRALFSTHYHELTELAKSLKHLKCFTSEVKEWEGKIIFMHRIIAGVASKSYGINVAELAGLPKIVITRASNVLENLHLEAKNPKQIKKPEEIIQGNIAEDKLRAKLKTQDPNNLTPKQALDLVFELNKLI